MTVPTNRKWALHLEFTDDAEGQAAARMIAAVLRGGPVVKGVWYNALNKEEFEAMAEGMRIRFYVESMN